MQPKQSLGQWDDAVLTPELEALGLLTRLDPKIPLYVESLPAFMAFSANAEAGQLPCKGCSKANGNISFCPQKCNPVGTNEAEEVRCEGC